MVQPPTAKQPDNMKYDVFISYKRDGGNWAELVRTILVYKYHLSVLDVGTMQGGEWHCQINDAIKDSRNVIMVLFENLEEKKAIFKNIIL